MDALMDHQAEIDHVVAGLLRPLIDQELWWCFYDMTTIRAEGVSTVEEDVRRFGMAKEGLIARQFMLGVVQTGDGLPIYHEVFAGNTAESPTLLPTLKTVLERFPSIRRVVLVADRGLLSLDNLDALSEIRLESGKPLELFWQYPDGVTASLLICCNLSTISSVRMLLRKSWVSWRGAICVWLLHTIPTLPANSGSCARRRLLP